MKRRPYYTYLIFAAIISTFLFSCSRFDSAAPSPNQESKITNLVVNLTDSFGYANNFSYNVPEGFDKPINKFSVDTVRMKPGAPYRVAIFLMNDKNNPDMDITKQLIMQSDQYLFIAYATSTDTGIGGIDIYNGNLDRVGQPFNQTMMFRAGLEGMGNLVVTVYKNPTNKYATTEEGIGGTIIAKGLFPIWIRR